MSNIMTSLWKAHSGMNINQSALNSTAHNLANINTEGYTRQQVIITDASYVNAGQSNSGELKIGTGAQVETLRQLRNEFYDSMFRSEKGRLGFFEAQVSVANDMESLFGEMEGETFQNSIENVWVSMEELAKEPESITSKTNFVNTALDFITRAKDIQTQIKSYQTDLNQTLKNTVNRINEIGEEIYRLNTEIAKAEAGNIERANDYRDKRNKLVDELSYYVDIETYEEINGSLNVIVEGQSFVTDMSVNHLKLDEVNETTTFLKPVWEKTQDDLYFENKLYITNNTTSVGYLKGLLMARGGNIADYTDMPVEPKKPQEGASTEKLQKYNEELQKYKKDVETYNRVIDASIVMNIETQFDTLIHGIVTALNDIFCPNIEANINPDNVSSLVKETDEVTIDGKKVTIDELKKIYGDGNVLILDNEKAPIGDDEDKTKGTELFSRNIKRYKEMVVTDSATDTQKVYYIYNQEDANDKKTLYTVSNLSINSDLKKNYSKLAINRQDKPDEYDYNGVIVDIIDLWNKDFQTLTPNTLAVCDYKEYYSSFVVNVGMMTRLFEDRAISQSEALQQLDDNKLNYMGVSSDEELSNLVKYQQSFNAVAKYYTAVNDMLEYIIEKLG